MRFSETDVRPTLLSNEYRASQYSKIPRHYTLLQWTNQAQCSKDHWQGGRRLWKSEVIGKLDGARNVIHDGVNGDDSGDRVSDNADIHKHGTVSAELRRYIGTV